MLKQEEQELQSKTRWLWYEFTPYEVGCDELGVRLSTRSLPRLISLQAWIPSWSFGRQFENGQNVERRVSETPRTRVII